MSFSSLIEHNRRQLVFDVFRRIEKFLEPFEASLDTFLVTMLASQLPADWREQWHAFIAEQKATGFTVLLESVRQLEAWIEAQAKRRGLLTEREKTQSAPYQPYADRHFDTKSGPEYNQEQAYDRRTNAWMTQDSIGTDRENEYRHVDIRSTTSIDRGGYVKLDLTPESPDSMDWYKWKAPAAGGKTGNTSTTHNGSWQMLSMKTDRGTIYKVRYIIKGTAQIWLDPTKIAKLEKTPKGLSLKQSYGHEQFHVKNFISIMEAAKKELEAFEDETYDSATAADAAAKKHLADVLKAADKKIKADAMHQTPGGPINGQVEDPIGTMPGDPIGTAK
jgi:hypothetical protein